MGRKAITLDQQIALLRSRGMIINDVEKAKEVLLDVGYYRLGFYWFPFEQTYPKQHHRTHIFQAGSEFDTAVKLYYFDFKLRSILSYYLNRIEVNFRNYITYTVSNQYTECPMWFADDTIVSPKFANSFQATVYDNLSRKNLVIRRHHAKHPQDAYAPAWKTLEFMTLGEIVNLYKALQDDKLRCKISNHFGIKYTDVFDNYIELVRNVRNYCAHGNVLFDFSPIKSIRKGPAGHFKQEEYNNLSGAVKVILYLLSHISVNRAIDMKEELTVLIQRYANFPQVKRIIKEISGLEDFIAPISK